jgi:hypothetical protein
MKMKFTLIMDEPVVKGRSLDSMTLEWTDDVSQDEVLSMSQQWLSSQTFLTERMIGLERVKESSLTIEPIPDE